MFTIFGSGFGLYGYLPALVEHLGVEVVLPQPYKTKVRSRPELGGTLSKIRWVKDHDEALTLADGVVIATPPQFQGEIVERCISRPNIKHLALEKPLAVTPGLAASLLARLDASGVQYVIAYTLLHLNWYNDLSWPSDPDAEMEVNWSFQAHHFSHDLHNWKRVHAQGGGPLRFFGVHILAMLASQGYSHVTSSQLDGDVPGEPERWKATLSGPGLPECRVSVDSRSPKSCFEITSKGKEHPLIALHDPFALEKATSDADPRVAVLAEILGQLTTGNASLSDVYKLTNDLWMQAEEQLTKSE
jgi:hypothetical protein